MRIPGGPKPNY
uniref:Uncharacterized protein n=1 Tax=Anguilla anguilla TaxID=7936 RepID=A0A0E9VKV7_ANGAN